MQHQHYSMSAEDIGETLSIPSETAGICDSNGKSEAFRGELADGA